MMEKQPKKKYDTTKINKQTLEVAQRNIHKKWEKKVSRNTLNPQEVEYRIQNNLPLTDLYNNLFTFGKSNGDKDL